MDKKKKTLADIFADDLDGLLNSKPAAPAARTEDERLVEKFEEVNAFFKQHKRAPKERNGVQEHQLFSRLKGFRENAAKIKQLEKYDIYDLLGGAIPKPYPSAPELPKVAEPAPKYIPKAQAPPIVINSIDDILNNDVLGILDNAGESIFKLTHVPKPSKKEAPDYVASRTPCKDFEQFEPVFLECQKDLREKKRQLLPFANEQQIGKGNFFVLKGILLYVAKVGKRKRVKGKLNARLRLIFENGTESDMLLRSLATELYKDGRRVTEHEERLLDNFKNITPEDKPTGYIYVLQSLSNDPQITAINNLYKIGYSNTSVPDRIKNAAKEPTYLMADVRIVSIFKVFNAEPPKLESLLHRFFGNACLNVDLYDGDGRLYRPREWFVAPFEVIEQAVHFIMNGEIVGFRYDLERGEIVGR